MMLVQIKFIFYVAFFILCSVSKVCVFLQITLLLRRVLSEVTPMQLSIILAARVPRRDKLVAAGSSDEQVRFQIILFNAFLIVF